MPNSVLTLILLLATSCSIGFAQARGVSASSPQQKMVIRYFGQVLDDGKVDVLEDLIDPDCAIHRPEGELKGLPALRSMVAARRSNFSTFHSNIHELIESGDRVVARLTHQGTASAPYRFRVGTHDVKGKNMTWDAIVIFRFDKGKIAEEWVSRDELGMLLTAGVLQSVNAPR
jgi:predicted ester cyclase